MRLDLFLKWSRVILRRTLAKEICDAGRAKINGSEARAGRDVRVGDVVTLELPRRLLKFRIQSIPARAPAKETAKSMIEVVDDRPNPRPGDGSSSNNPLSLYDD
jgi:ribosomal 50S subunit-recycling heat shock protein